jgi:tRNA 2-thiouridine synthesizing protein A
MSDVNPDLELDLRGQLCPMPVIKLAKAITGVPVGGVIRAVATDPASRPDFDAWARSTGHELLSTEESDGEFVFLVKRTR